jgi:hypothetical protein
MAYNLNKTDGSLLVELVDGKVDSSSTDITLIGKNYQGFGEFLNENFIKILESFANTAAPSKAIKGQLWYDTAEGRLKVYDGTAFKSTDSTIFTSSQPTNLTQGDIWIDGTNNQMYFWDGSSLVLVGPQYTKTQTRSGTEVSTIKDTTGQNRIVIKFYIGGSLVGIYSKAAFTPFPAISGFTNLLSGFNVSSAFSDFAWLGKATSAGALIDDSGTYTKDSFLSATSNDSTTGSLTVNNASGIFIGADNRFNIKKSGTTTVLENTGADNPLEVKLRRTVGASFDTYSAFKFDATNQRLGIFNDNPTDDVVIGVATTSPKNLVVTGDLTVLGDTVYMDVSNLTVEDKQIELAVTSDSSLLNDTQLDGAGIIVQGTDGSKDWTWSLSTGSWTSNQGIDISNDTESYKIDTVDVLSKTTLGSTVINSSLTSVGTLTELQVDNININGSRISAPGTLDIAAVGTVDFISSPKLINVGTPTADSHVATKGYVDSTILSTDILLTLDVTGIGLGYATGTWLGGGDQTLLTNVCTILQEINPANSAQNGKIATIHAYRYTANTDPIDVNSSLVKSTVAVDKNGVENQSVLEDVLISPNPTTTVSLTITRYTITLEIVSGIWDPESGEITASAV